MWIDRLWDRRSLRARLLSTYLVILGIGGLVTSLIGSWIVSSAIMAQMHRALSQNLATVSTIYDERLRALDNVVRLTAFGPALESFVEVRDPAALLAHLDRVRRDNRLDFLTLTDARGRVIVRPTNAPHLGDDASPLGPVSAALAGRHVAATEVIAAAWLADEDAALGARVSAGTPGLVMMAAAPVQSAGEPLRGVLYGGVLLNDNHEIVDGAAEILFSDERFRGEVIGEVSILVGNHSVATTARAGERGTGRPDAADPGGSPSRREGFVGASQPIHDHDGAVVGVLHVGVLEQVYTWTRNRVILSFFALATAGFILIIIVTDYMVRQITRPIREMVLATRNLAAGRFDQEVRADWQGEIGLLAESFNRMLGSLRQMKADLEEWGSTLEDKVQQRTEQLVAMQNRVAQSEKLASLGMLSAGVAHEINNPLGGILSLTALALEDLTADAPVRPNLEEVVRQSERCREIVKGLLEFSRQQEAGSDLIDVRQVLDETLSLMGKQALFFNVNVHRNYESTIPMVLADRSQLQQVFINSIMNAVQAMGEHGDLTIDVHAIPGSQVEVRVADTGCGIPAADLARVFDPFYTTKPEGEGTGLGLSIAYGIITKHNGTIAIESEVGKGTVVVIRLPGSSEMAEELPGEAGIDDRCGEPAGRR